MSRLVADELRVILLGRGRAGVETFFLALVLDCRDECEREMFVLQESPLR
jgi:hypothetical protein